MNSHYFTCYWDESGSDPGTETRSKSDTSILLVGGYLAHFKEWQDFECKWNQLLINYGQRIGHDLRPFHMVAFANCRYPYNKLTDSDYEGLISSLLGVIKEYARFFVVWAIEVDAYLEIIKARHLLEQDITHAYHICARKCIESVSLWAKVAKHQNKILHIFDKGNAAWSSFEDSFNQEFLNILNILRPISQSKEDVVPLQAADILAHQMARDLLVSHGKMKIGQRNYVDNLFTIPGMCQYIDTTELARLYPEEIKLEQMRAMGRFPPRVIDWTKAPGADKIIQMLAELFKEPRDYELRKHLPGDAKSEDDRK